MPSSSLRRGCFISFEGVEGAGKSTQLKLLAAVLRQRGYPVVPTFEPGHTALGAAIRDLLMRPSGPPPVPLTELLLYLADRAQHLEQIIRPALDRGAVVLCDRFSGSTIAYQGYGRGLDIDTVVQLDAVVRGGLAPSLTILLDCPVEEGLRRAVGDDRLHREAVEFHRRVQEGFRQLAANDRRWVTIRSDQPAEVVAEQTVDAVIRANVLPECPSPTS